MKEVNMMLAFEKYLYFDTIECQNPKIVIIMESDGMITIDMNIQQDNDEF